MISFTDFEMKTLGAPTLGVRGKSVEQQLADAAALGPSTHGEQQQLRLAGD